MSKNLVSNLPADFAFDLAGLKLFPGILDVKTAGKFLNLNAQASVKQAARRTFPVKLSQSGSGLCVLKINLQNYLETGEIQHQDLPVAPPRNPVGIGAGRKRGRKTNREKDAAAALIGGAKC